MLEEEKIIEAEPIAEEAVAEPVSAAPVNNANEDVLAKNAMVAFIISLIGFCFVASGIVSIILGAIGLNKAKAANGVTRKPHSVFVKVAKPVSIFNLVAGICMVAFWVIFLIVTVVGIALAAATAA